MKTTLGRPLQVSLRLAIQSPNSWDVLGLLEDAADNLDEVFGFLRSLLNPEENGHAVSAYIRDEARKLLNQKPCEQDLYSVPVNAPTERKMRLPTIHYSGGIRATVGKMFCIRLPGWPACCSGVRCEKIAELGNMTRDRDKVTCKACLKLIDAQDKTGR